MFILKFAVLVGLLAESYAAPLKAREYAASLDADVISLERRAGGTIPPSVTCGNDRFGRPITFTRQRILDQLKAADVQRQTKAPDGKWYPVKFFNGSPSGNVLRDPAALAATTRGDLREEPLGLRQTWQGGDLKFEGASMHRVIYDNSIIDHEKSYIGVVYHTGVGNNFAPCVEVDPDCAPATTRRSLWDIVRRAAGQKPAKGTKKCKKPTSTPKPKTPAPKPKAPASKPKTPKSKPKTS